MLSLLRPALAASARWRLPTQCAVCRDWGGRRVCAACVARFVRPVARCRRCALRLAGSADVCGACLRRPPAFDAGIAAADYDHPVDGLVTRLKFHDGLDLAGVLADILAQACSTAPRPDLLLPIPLGRARLRERGYNQAWELARRAGRRLGVAADPSLLLRIKETPHQTGLPLHERAANIRGAFAVEPLRAEALRGRAVALVDDVMTTGATAHEAALALKQAGAASVGVVGARPHAGTGWLTMFEIVLVHPEIPPNTGNVIRLAANTGCALHLVEPLGFSMEDKLLQRAGLDYHEYASVHRHASWEALLRDRSPDPRRIFAFTTRGAMGLAEARFQPGDWLVFGSETSGLPSALRETFPTSQRVRLPMRPGQRSLNLSNAVAVTVFEAWRQNVYAGGA